MTFLVTSGASAIAAVYLQLAAEDHRWWWTSWSVPATSGLYYVAVYSMFFWYNMKYSDVSSLVVYFGYVGMVGMLVALMAGAAGHLAASCYVWRVYTRFKADDEAKEKDR